MTPPKEEKAITYWVARYLFNQGVSDFALRDLPPTFQDKFLGSTYCKIKKLLGPCI
jgi:hypothetical protein